MCKVVLSPEGKFVGRFRAEDNCEVYLTTETRRDREGQGGSKVNAIRLNLFQLAQPSHVIL